MGRCPRQVRYIGGGLPLPFIIKERRAGVALIHKYIQMFQRDECMRILSYPELPSEIWIPFGKPQRMNPNTNGTSNHQMCTDTWDTWERVDQTFSNGHITVAITDNTGNLAIDPLREDLCFIVRDNNMVSYAYQSG